MTTLTIVHHYSFVLLITILISYTNVGGSDAAFVVVERRPLSLLQSTFNNNNDDDSGSSVRSRSCYSSDHHRHRRRFGSSSSSSTNSHIISYAAVTNPFHSPDIVPSTEEEEEEQPNTISTTTTTHDRTPAVISSADEAWKIIDTCAVLVDRDNSETSNKSNNDDDADSLLQQLLWKAVHYLEQHSYELTSDQLEELWDNAHGSWQLVLSTGSSHNQIFQHPPVFLPFSFAMIDDMYFGNGIGWDSHHIWLALRDHHTYDITKRRLEVSVDEVFVMGHQVCFPSFDLPKQIMALAKQFESDLDNNNNTNSKKKKKQKQNKPPPTFILIGASKSSLVARGNQSGGLAIWTRLPHDIRPVAYHNK